MLRSHNKTILEALGRNPIHPFPARMAPGIALDALGASRIPLRVLDPMAGSGTVLAVARANGHRAFGYDLDPLAVLLASVWTRSIDADSVRRESEIVLTQAKKTFASLTFARAYPAGCDEETREFIRYWFDDYARKQLTSLSIAIEGVRDRAIRDALWCGFSRLIITKQAGASLAMDLSHSRPHRAFSRAPIKPFRRFISAVETVVANCPQVGSKKLGPIASMKQGDARKLGIEANSIDLVLTSPPYLNAIDYMRCSKFSLVWMGHDIESLRQIRGESVGAESSSADAKGVAWIEGIISRLRMKPELGSRDYAILCRYVMDLGRAIAEVFRVLNRNGRAVYVIGDSTVRNTFVPNSKIVQMVGEAQGLSLHSRHSRELPANRRYLPPPKAKKSLAAMDARMRREVVLVFNKSVA